MISSIVKFCLICSVTLLLGGPVGAQTRFNESELVGTFNSYVFTITFEPKGRYREIWGDCTTESFESGKYTFKDGVIFLEASERGVRERDHKHWQNLFDPKVNQKFNGDDPERPIRWELLPVSWGDRLYLISHDSLIDFVNAINFGVEPRGKFKCDWPGGSFYLREGDRTKKVSGKPSLPAELLAMLLERPVEAQIIAIEGDGDKKIAILNQGTAAGLRPGMRLMLDGGQPKFWGGMQIIAADEKSARLSLDEGAKIGDKVVSNFEQVRLTVTLNQK